MYSLTPDYQFVTFTQNNISTHILYTQYTSVYINFGANLVLKKFGTFVFSSYLCTVNNKH